MKSRRTAAAMVLVLVALAVTSLMIASQAATLIARHRLARQLSAKTQAQWLAESALQRARVQHARLTEYAGETWRPEVAESETRPTAQLATIELKTSAEGEATFEIIARVGSAESPSAAMHVLRESLVHSTAGAAP